MSAIVPFSFCASCKRTWPGDYVFCTQCGKRTVPQETQLEVSFSGMHKADYSDLEPKIKAFLDDKDKFEKWFLTEVAGASFNNSDGSSRQEILSRCERAESLILKWERDNPVSKEAVSVCRANGEQIGYLNSRLAHETLTRFRDGETWGAFIVRIVGGDNGHYFGATIAMIKLRKGTGQ